jgi:HD-GYP domain-containing protein (c-di-GMP phosphodiesterase class II)
MQDRGGEIAVERTQQKTFLKQMDLKEEEVPSLREKRMDPLEIEREESKKELDQDEKRSGKYNFKKELHKAISEENFLPLIVQTRKEVVTFSVKISHTVSLAIFMCRELLIEDNFINRIVAMAYLSAKNSGTDDEESLGDLICAAFFSHLGHTQMDMHYSKKSQLQQSDEHKREYQKHPGLAHHLIRKSGIDLSSRCIDIINDHHERADGNGYPNNTTEKHIDSLALVLGASSFIMEYSSGKINGDTTSIVNTLRNIRNYTPDAGMEFEFGGRVYTYLVSLVDTASNKAAA